MRFDVLLGLVLHMTNLFNLPPQLVNHSKGMSLRVLFLRAHRIRNIIIVMSHVPNSIVRTQLVPLTRMRVQLLNLLGDL